MFWNCGETSVQQEEMKMSQRRSVSREENMQNGVSDEVVTAGCQWKAQTFYHRSLGSTN